MSNGLKKFKFLAKSKISQLPKGSGVYAFKKGREFLYIGKASNLRDRIRNHFQQPAYRNNLFINQVKKIGFINTNSEIEALILEANLIKKYQPKYNVIWRDDKNYFFVGVTKEDFPRIFWTHQTKLSSKIHDREKMRKFVREIQYVGPFVDGKALKQTLKILRKVFPYRSCKTLPKHPCLWYHLKRCPAPCLFEPDKSSLLQSTILSARIKREIKELSQRNVRSLMGILRGKKIQVLKSLKKEMKKASASQDFEKAAKIRDQIKALEKVLAHTKILFETVDVKQRRDWNELQKILQKILKTKRKISRIEAYDISNIQGQEATGSMITFINGLPDKNFYRRFKIKISGKPDDIAMIKECLSRRFGHPEWGFPDLILIDGGRAQLNAAISCLTFKFKQPKVLALAKKKNELFIEGRKKPILLKNLDREIFDLILQARDEAHRFAISYHRKLRKRVLLE